MPSQGVEPVTGPFVIDLARHNRVVLVRSSILFGVLGLLGLIGAAKAIMAGDPTMIVLTGGIGVALTVMCVIGLTRRKVARTLTIDAEGIHHSRDGAAPWTVHWSELEAVTVRFARRKVPRGETTIGYVYGWLDWYPVDGEPQPRDDIAEFWQRAGAEGHYRMNVPPRQALGHQILQGVHAHHPELWGSR